MRTGFVFVLLSLVAASSAFAGQRGTATKKRTRYIASKVPLIRLWKAQKPLEIARFPLVRAVKVSIRCSRKPLKCVGRFLASGRRLADKLKGLTVPLRVEEGTTTTTVHASTSAAANVVSSVVGAVADVVAVLADVAVLVGRTSKETAKAVAEIAGDVAKAAAKAATGDGQTSESPGDSSGEASESGGDSGESSSDSSGSGGDGDGS